MAVHGLGGPVCVKYKQLGDTKTWLLSNRGTATPLYAVKECLQDEGIEVALDNHVLHRLHGDFQKIGVGRIGVMDVDFLLRLPY
jgi:hypothetical protein